MAAALIGRDAELDALVTSVREGRRLLTVLGPPGIGKTSLARAVAERLERTEQGIALFCDLGAAASEEALAGAVSTALESVQRADFVFGAGKAGSATERVTQLLEERGRTLLVLDNFERLCPFSSAVQRWLATAPYLVVLVTSRERLGVPEELVIELTSLPYPPLDASLEEIAGSPAVQLFRSRAGDAGASGLDDLEATADVVRRLEGIPLAIELAASRARVMSPRELAQRLERGHDLLAAGSGHPGRHRTLFAAIAWSWELLHPDERLALAVCSTFEKSFAVGRAEELVERALSRRGASARAALDVIAALRDKSLIRLNDAGRLTLYESIREFARRRLEEMESETSLSIREDHLRAFGALAERFLTERLFLSGEPRQEVVAEARLEAENICAAHRFARGTPAAREQRLTVALAAAIAFLHAAPADETDAELVRLLERADRAPADRAVLLLARQSSMGALGRHEEAIAVAPAVLALEDVDVGLRAFALVYAGTQLRADGDARGSLALHEEANALLSGRPFTRLYAMNLSCMGRLACDLRLLDRARELNERASKLCDDRGDRFLAALGIANLAQLEQEARSFRRAEQLFTDAIGRFSAAHEPQYQGIYETRLATLYLEWDRIDDAFVSFSSAERSLSRLHTPTSRVLLFACWAVAESAAGRHEEAAARLGQARRAAQRGAQGVTGLALDLLGGAVELLGPSPDPSAVAYWERRAAELGRSGGDDPPSHGQNLDARFAMRMLERALGRHKQARCAPVLRLGPDALWFAVDDYAPVDLARRGPMRRMLAALVDARQSRPGRTLDRDALFGAGWPDERVQIEAAATRVRVAVATLRKLGLRELLVTRDDGYLIDPEVEVHGPET